MNLLFSSWISLAIFWLGHTVENIVFKLPIIGLKRWGNRPVAPSTANHDGARLANAGSWGRRLLKKVARRPSEEIIVSTKLFS